MLCFFASCSSQNKMETEDIFIEKISREETEETNEEAKTEESVKKNIEKNDFANRGNDRLERYIQRFEHTHTCFYQQISFKFKRAKCPNPALVFCAFGAIFRLFHLISHRAFGHRKRLYL